MPVSVTTARDPFRAGAKPVPPRPAPRHKSGLRMPQARVLAALLPAYPSDPPSEWPLLTRAALAARAGYTEVSGSITRALNGIHPDSSSGDPHLGLLAQGLVEVQVVDVDGVSEMNYRATAAGVAAYQTWVAGVGILPKVRDAAACTNDRYKE